jgi:hypothetical protein
MALANLALAPAALTFPVLVSAGRIGDALRASLISLPPSAAIIIGAAFFSLETVAASLLLVAPFQMLVAFLFIRRAIGLTASELALTLRGNALLALGCALAPVLVVATSPSGFDLTWTRTLLALAGGGAGWLAAMIAVDHPAKREITGAGTFLMERLLPERWGKAGPQPTSRRTRS